MTTSCVFLLQKKMVKIGLQLKALLENVTGVEAEGEDFRWALYTVYTAYCLYVIFNKKISLISIQCFPGFRIRIDLMRIRIRIRIQHFF
jgi:hypothetical protein